MTENISKDPTCAEAGSLASALLRLLPLVILAGAALVFLLAGGRKFVSADFLLASRETIVIYVAAHQWSAPLLFGIFYALVVMLSIPGASLLTLFGGLIFGPLLNTAVVVVAATLGAATIFQAAGTSLGGLFRRWTGPRLGAFTEGMRRDAASYMLFLRLTPLFPFWLVNIAAALVGVNFRTFVWTTLVGIIPMTFAISLAGGAIDSVIAHQIELRDACVASGRGGCELHLSLLKLVTPELLAAAFLLGVLSLVPVALRRFRVHSAGKVPAAERAKHT